MGQGSPLRGFPERKQSSTDCSAPNQLPNLKVVQRTIPSLRFAEACIAGCPRDLKRRYSLLLGTAAPFTVTRCVLRGRQNWVEKCHKTKAIPVARTVNALQSTPLRISHPKKIGKRTLVLFPPIIHSSYFLSNVGFHRNPTAYVGL